MPNIDQTRHYLDGNCKLVKSHVRLVRWYIPLQSQRRTDLIAELQLMLCPVTVHCVCVHSICLPFVNGSVMDEFAGQFESRTRKKEAPSEASSGMQLHNTSLAAFALLAQNEHKSVQSVRADKYAICPCVSVFVCVWHGDEQTGQWTNELEMYEQCSTGDAIVGAHSMHCTPASCNAGLLAYTVMQSSLA